MEEAKQDCEAWLREADEAKEHIPNNCQELSQRIRTLRQRLEKIGVIYGCGSSQALAFSQYVDKFVVHYQRLDLKNRRKI